MSDYLLVFALNLDVLFACAACASSGICIPLRSRLVIALVGCASLALSLGAGSLLAAALPPHTLRLISFSALFLIGLSSLLHEFMQSVLAKCKKISIRVFRYIIDICLDETCADSDRSRHLSAAEALALALPLSADSLLTGLSMTGGAQLLLLSFACGLGAAALGTRLGSFSRAQDSSLRPVLCGVLFLVLAFVKLM